MDLIKGQVKNFVTNQIFQANSNLTSQEALKIASSARLAGYLDGNVNWCQAALKAAKAEGKDKKFVGQAKEVHDKYYNSLDWLNKKITGVIRTNEVPYYQ